MTFESSRASQPDDLLLWEDGFWCFPAEHQDNLSHGDNYRVIPNSSAEWGKLTSQRLPNGLGQSNSKRGAAGGVPVSSKVVIPAS